MGISKKQRSAIRALLIKKIEDKLENYTRETSYMPFLTKLVQDVEKVASYSFIHSIATSLGMSIYEEVSKIIASSSAKEADTQVDVGGLLSAAQKTTISNIVRELRNGERKVNKAKETREVLAASARGGKPHKENNKADFYMKRGRTEYYFEIKTAKPNIPGFTSVKRQLLEWVARKRKPVKTILVLPYNPYYPEPYERFSEQGLLEKKKELLIAEEYWDFLGGRGTYRQLLKEFDFVGKKYRRKVSRKIKEVAREKLSR